jgi:hypothetical protein
MQSFSFSFSFSYSLSLSDLGIGRCSFSESLGEANCRAHCTHAYCVLPMAGFRRCRRNRDSENSSVYAATTRFACFSLSLAGQFRSNACGSLSLEILILFNALAPTYRQGPLKVRYPALSLRNNSASSKLRLSKCLSRLFTVLCRTSRTWSMALGMHTHVVHGG